MNVGRPYPAVKFSYEGYTVHMEAPGRFELHAGRQRTGCSAETCAD